MSNYKTINTVEDLKEVLKNNPDFSLDDLKSFTPDLDNEAPWFNDRITIPILRRLLDSYDELDMEDLCDMYLNSNFFDEDFDIQDDDITVKKLISLIQFWSYKRNIGIFVIE